MQYPLGRRARCQRDLIRSFLWGGFEWLRLSRKTSEGARIREGHRRRGRRRDNVVWRCSSGVLTVASFSPLVRKLAQQIVGQLSPGRASVAASERAECFASFRLSAFIARHSYAHLSRINRADGKCRKSLGQNNRRKRKVTGELKTAIDRCNALEMSILSGKNPFLKRTEPTGLEPATSAVTGQRSNQLS
jgi:hypothetical protein